MGGTNRTKLTIVKLFVLALSRFTHRTSSKAGCWHGDDPPPHQTEHNSVYQMKPEASRTLSEARIFVLTRNQRSINPYRCLIIMQVAAKCFLLVLAAALTSCSVERVVRYSSLKLVMFYIFYIFLVEKNRTSNGLWWMWALSESTPHAPTYCHNTVFIRSWK